MRFVVGRFSLRHVLRAVATSGSQENFTATALLVVIGVALLMESVGLPTGLGAFLTGVLLADSEYRHELDANRGLGVSFWGGLPREPQ